MDSFNSYANLVNKASSRWQHVKDRVREERDALATAEQTLTHAAQAQALVQTVAEQVQQAAHQQVSGVVSRCLRAVYGEDAYQFEIRFRQLRGRTDAQLVFTRDGNEYLDPVNQCSGGQVELAAFGLRLASILLERPRKRRLLIQDEPYKSIEKGKRPAVLDLLLTLAKELGFQFVISTHLPEMVGGKVVEL